MGYIPDFTLDADLEANIAVNSGPIGGIAVTADGRRLLVTNHGGDSVSVIDTGTGAVVETISGTEEPFAIATSSASSRCAYVSTACAASDAIVAIDTRANTVLATHRVAFRVTDLAVSPDGKCVYASRTGGDVVVLDTATGALDVIGLGAAPGTSAERLHISPDGHRLYAALHTPSGGQLAVIDIRAKQVVDTLEIGSPIRDVALSPGGETAYVLGCSPDFGAAIDIIDTRANLFTSTVKIGEVGGTGGYVTQLVLSAAGDRAYLVGDGGVTVLSTLTLDVIGTITVGGQPSCAIESPDRNRLYVADYEGAVAVVSTPPLATGADDDVTARFLAGARQPVPA